MPKGAVKYFEKMKAKTDTQDRYVIIMAGDAKELSFDPLFWF